MFAAGKVVKWSVSGLCRILLAFLCFSWIKLRHNGLLSHYAVPSPKETSPSSTYCRNWRLSIATRTYRQVVIVISSLRTSVRPFWMLLRRMHASGTLNRRSFQRRRPVAWSFFRIGRFSRWSTTCGHREDKPTSFLSTSRKVTYFFLPQALMERMCMGNL